jgi:hypothetical protein
LGGRRRRRCAGILVADRLVEACGRVGRLRRFFGFLLRRFCLLGLRRCGSRITATLGRIIGAFAFAGEDGDHGIDLDTLGASRDDDLGDGAFIDSFDFHRRLVGLDLGDHIAGANLVAFLDQPFGEVALLHGGRQGGHCDVDRHLTVLPYAV